MLVYDKALPRLLCRTSFFNLQIAKAFRLIAQVGLIVWGIDVLSAYTPLN